MEDRGGNEYCSCPVDGHRVIRNQGWMNRSLEAMQETHITCKHLGRKGGGMYAGCRNYLMDKAKRSKLKKAGKLISQILKYFCPVQSNYTTCYVVLHFCVHVYLCTGICVFEAR